MARARVTGIFARTSAGTAKLPASPGATHRNSDVEFEGKSTPPPTMNTDAPSAAPLQLTVRPLESVTASIASRFVQENGCGGSADAVKVPMSMPPEVVTV